MIIFAENISDVTVNAQPVVTRGVIRNVEINDRLITLVENQSYLFVDVQGTYEVTNSVATNIDLTVSISNVNVYSSWSVYYPEGSRVRIYIYYKLTGTSSTDHTSFIV